MTCCWFVPSQHPPRLVRVLRRSALAATAFSLVAAQSAVDIAPFDGASLNGWSGDLRYWRAEDGAIVGQSSPENPLQASTYLVWQGDMPRDFELTCKWKLQGGNSGIHYRSRVVDGQSDLQGYQADMDADDSYTGVLYEGLGRSLMSARGEQVEWDAEGKRVLAQFAPDSVLRPVIKRGEWNEYRIEAQGTRMRHWINGTLMSDVNDGDASRFRGDGSLALQLHAGPGMEVRYRDLKVRALRTAPDAASLAVPQGFSAQLILSAQEGQGSWVCLTFDERGRIILSPQEGGLMRIRLPGVSRNTDGTPWMGDQPVVEHLQSPVCCAQGLCVAHGFLFAVDARGKAAGGGLWRMADADDDGRFEDCRRLIGTEAGGEHGAHGVIQGPDALLYWVIGNHVPLPEEVATDAVTHSDDLVGEREWDPRGHAVGLHAPGGVVVRLDPDAERVELVASGFRNAYDLAFDGGGELFTYDSDMEWDIGAPWYRAPRVVHVVHGGDYGWRSGSGKLPPSYIDTLPPACETDFSSPTGMAFGGASAFPEPWRSRMFVGDWTYGRILAIDLNSEGARVRGSWIPFVSGRPMPVSDFEFGPDGAMYMITGGRGVQSGLYRIAADAATGAASTHISAPVSGPNPARASHDRRRKIESLQHPMEPAEFEAVFPALLAAMDDDDRFIRYAARIGMENQSVGAWRSTILSDERRAGALTGLLALVRCGSQADAYAALTRLAELVRAGLEPSQLGDALRIAEVALARHPSLATSAPMGVMGDAAVAAIAGEVVALRYIGAELACALNRADALEPTLAAIESAPDRATAMHFAFVLRNVSAGWTDSTRDRYWRWLDAASAERAGLSLAGFLEAIRADALQNAGKSAAGEAPAAAPSSEQAASDSATAAAILAAANSKGSNPTLHAWTVAELEQAAHDETGPRNLQRGREVYAKSLCIQCHRVSGEGGGNGPDLTGVVGRFSTHDLLQALIEPSRVVSDQYRDSVVELTDGSLVVGRIIGDDGTSLTVATNPFSNERQVILKSVIVHREELSTSSMPQGLLDSRSRDEVLDLLAYLQSSLGH